MEIPENTRPIPKIVDQDSNVKKSQAIPKPNKIMPLYGSMCLLYFCRTWYFLARLIVFWIIGDKSFV